MYALSFARLLSPFHLIDFESGILSLLRLMLIKIDVSVTIDRCKGACVHVHFLFIRNRIGVDEFKAHRVQLIQGMIGESLITSSASIEFDFLVFNYFLITFFIGRNCCRVVMESKVKINDVIKLRSLVPKVNNSHTYFHTTHRNDAY